MAPSPTLEVRDLVVRRGEVDAVAGASFAAEPGEITVLLGPNGAGKTTTVETLLGQLRPTSGQVRVLGADPAREARSLRRRVGAMPQGGGMYPGLRPAEAIRLFASYYPDPRDPEELLATVGLEQRRSVAHRHLSGGEQQRLSLALALVGRPDVVLLDEPTAGVDLDGRRGLRELVAGLRADGVTVLVTTHDLDEAERLPDRIVILDRGVVVADGTPDELLSSVPRDRLTFSAPPGLDTAALGSSLGARVEEERAGHYRVEAAPSPRLVADLTAWLAERDLAVGELRGGRERLEELFDRLTRDDG